MGVSTASPGQHPSALARRQRFSLQLHGWTAPRARELLGLCIAPCAAGIKLPAMCFAERSGSGTVSTCTGLLQPCLGGTITPQFVLWKVPVLLNIFEEWKVPLGTLTVFFFAIECKSIFLE